MNPSEKLKIAQAFKKNFDLKAPIELLIDQTGIQMLWEIIWSLKAEINELRRELDSKKEEGSSAKDR